MRRAILHLNCYIKINSTPLIYNTYTHVIINIILYDALCIYLYNKFQIYEILHHFCNPDRNELYVIRHKELHSSHYV